VLNEIGSLARTRPSGVRRIGMQQTDWPETLTGRWLWLAALDDFRNWLAWADGPAKRDENRCAFRVAPVGSGEIDSSQWSHRGRATV
jgi:hypothetical protein